MALLFVMKCKAVCGLSWIAFLATGEAIRQWFPRVTKSRVKIIAKSPHDWQKTLLTVTQAFFYLLRAIHAVNTQIR